MIYDFKKKICSKIYLNLNKNIKNTVLLAGSGRSGTTWISNIINYDNEYRYIFEPFSNIYTKECFGFAYKQYLRENDDREYFLKTARKIFSGEISNDWVNKFNKRFFCKKRLVKDIRVNFLLKWIREHFSEILIIFVVRHPIAVASSRMKLGWATHMEKILAQEDLITDFFQDVFDKIQDCPSSFERQIFLWCIENYVPLVTLGKENVYMLSYESFCLEPERESQKMLCWIGKKYNNSIKAAIRKPSEVSSSHSAINTGENLVCKWKKEVTRDECKKAIKILSLFGMEQYYSEEPYPLKSFEFV